MKKTYRNICFFLILILNCGSIYGAWGKSVMPLGYIIFILMKLLKERKKKMIISLEQLYKVISEFFAESQLDEETKENLLGEFNFKYELDVVLDKYTENLVFDGNNIIQISDINIDDLQERMLEYDSYLIDIIDDFFKFNPSIFEILRIRINTKRYDNLLALEEKIEDAYSSFAECKMIGQEISNTMIKRLNYDIAKRNLFINIMSGCSSQDCKDLYYYSVYKARLNSGDADSLLNFKIYDKKIIDIIEKDVFQRSLFLVDTNREYTIVNLLLLHIDVKFRDKIINKELFYRKVISTIEAKVNNVEYDNLNELLMQAKYSLMYVMDMLFYEFIEEYNYLFKENDIKENNDMIDCSFVEEEIFYLINEVFEYTDIDVAKDTNIDFEVNIKAILIEAYYGLTKDERVIEAIKSHNNYGKYHFVTELFDDMMKNCNNKTKKRELE